MLHSTGQGLIKMGYEPRNQESMPDDQKKANETGDNGNTIDINKYVDKHMCQRTKKDNVSQLWHYKLQASVKPFL